MTSLASIHTVRPVDEIDYLAERGLGPWLKDRREKKGMTTIELSQAATVGQRTVTRYEGDQGLGYETLRILDALGIRLRPEPLKRGPASVNRELRDLRAILEERAAAEREWREEYDRRLAAVEALAEKDAAATGASLLALQAAIARIEQLLLAQEGDDHQAGSES